jgi:hypothetical protein
MQLEDVFPDRKRPRELGTMIHGPSETIRTEPLGEQPDDDHSWTKVAHDSSGCDKIVQMSKGRAELSVSVSDQS